MAGVYRIRYVVETEKSVVAVRHYCALAVASFGFTQWDYKNSDALQRTIEDVCDDKHFPLAFESYEVLQERYLGPFWGFLSDAEMANHEWKDDRALALKFLVMKWSER